MITGRKDVAVVKLKLKSSTRGARSQRCSALTGVDLYTGGEASAPSPPCPGRAIYKTLELELSKDRNVPPKNVPYLPGELLRSMFEH